MRDVSQQIALRPEAGEASLMAALKALELERTLDAEPVLTALRHFPAQPARSADFPAGLHPRLLEVLRRPVVRNGQWQLLECSPAWDGNWTWDRFVHAQLEWAFDRP
jgi:hypothetical protein